MEEEAHVADDVLGASACDAVAAEAQRIVHIVASKEVAVRTARAHVAALRHGLMEQRQATERAIREAKTTRIRIHEAERAIERVRGNLPPQGGKLQGDLLSELHAATKRRDDAREMALQLQIQVDMLADLVRSAVVPAFNDLSEQIQRVGDQLAALEEANTSNKTLVITANDKFRSKSTRVALIHERQEARWVELSVRLDQQREKQHKAPTRQTQINTWNEARDVEKHSISLHELCQQLQEACVLLE